MWDGERKRATDSVVPGCFVALVVPRGWMALGGSKHVTGKM